MRASLTFFLRNANNPPLTGHFLRRAPSFERPNSLPTKLPTQTTTVQEPFIIHKQYFSTGSPPPHSESHKRNEHHERQYERRQQSHQNDNNHGNGNGHSKWADFYYRLSAIAIPLGLVYAVAKGSASEEAQKLKRKYFPPTVSGIVSNISQHESDALMPEKAISKVESEIEQRKYNGSVVIVISGSAGIGKYTVAKETATRALQQRISDRKSDITIWSIDSTDQDTIEEGYRKLAEKMGLKNSQDASASEVTKFIARELWAKKDSIIIYKCAKGPKFPGDDILYYRGMRSKTTAIITTGSEQILEEATNRGISIINLQGQASIRDLKKFAENHPDFQRFLSGGELIAMQQLAYDTYQRDFRLLSQTVAYLQSNPSTRIEDFSSGMSIETAPEVVLSRCLESAKSMYRGKDREDVTKTLQLIAPKDGSQKGIDTSTLYESFAQKTGSLAGVSNQIKRRVQDSCDCLIRGGLASFDPVSGKIFPVMLSSQAQFIEERQPDFPPLTTILFPMRTELIEDLERQL